MKMLFLSVYFPPPMEGGSLVYLYNLASHLPPSEVVVYTNTKAGHAEFDRGLPFRVERSRTLWPGLSEFGKMRMLWGWMKVVPDLVRREGIALIQAGDLAYAGVLCRLLRRRLRVPYIGYAYAEELTFGMRERGIRGVYSRGLLQYAISGADGFVAVSDYTIGLLKARGADERRMCKIVPSVRPLPPSEPALLASVAGKYGINRRAKVILCVGRLIARKGQDTLLRALPAIVREVPEVQLVLAGRGPDAARLQTLAGELAMREHVVFTGFVPDAEVPVLYDLCTVFAMPHRELNDGDTEGCPTVFLEANVRGKPVVGGDAGGVRDAILDGETGYVVDGRQPETVARAVGRLLRDPALAERLGQQGRLRVLEELSPRRGAERLTAFSAGILESTKHHE